MKKLRNVNKLLLATLVLFSLIGCFSAKHYQDEVRIAVEKIGKKFVPDKRLGVWDIDLIVKKNRINLVGETTSSSGLDSLKSFLEKQFENIDFGFEVNLLPLENLKNTHAVVRVCVGHLRREPDVSAEMITQAIMGAPLEILKTGDGYYYVRMEDGYLGWISKSSVTAGSGDFLEKWLQSDLGIYKSINGFIYENPRLESYPISDIVLGARVKISGKTRDWLKVELPDGRKGYIPEEEIIGIDTFKDIKPNGDNILDLAMRLRGISYTWGGTSVKGLDCSGFTQTVFKMNGVELLRDANMQATQGIEIDTSGNFGNLSTGDLLFFGPKPDRITHVGIYIGNRQFIHESGMVKINSLNPADANYSKYRAKSLRLVKRVF